jgi:hypothetical protein
MAVSVLLERRRGKVTLEDRMLDHIIETLKRLGGSAPAGQIRKLAKQSWRSISGRLPPSCDSLIYNTVQHFSSDAKRFKHGRNTFRMFKEHGQRWWALRKSFPESRLGNHRAGARAAAKATIKRSPRRSAKTRISRNGR